MTNVLSKQSFTESGYLEVMKLSEKNDCRAYGSLFLAEFNKIEDTAEPVKKEIFGILADVTSMGLKEESIDKPFVPMMTVGNQRTAIPDDLTDHHLSFLKDIASDVLDADLRARIADILWVRKRDIAMADLAIASYLESSLTLGSQKESMLSSKRMERALRLSISLGKSRESLKNTVSHIENAIENFNDTKSPHVPAHLMKLLLEYGQGDPGKYISLSDKLATLAEEQQDWWRARSYWEIKASWANKLKDSELQRNVLINAAETYVREAEIFLAATSPNYLVASHNLEQAIEAYRRIGNSHERIEELHKKLLEYQEQSVKEMKSVSVDVDVSQFIEKARALVAGKSLQDAIVVLVRLVSSPSVVRLKKQAQKNQQTFIASNLFSTLAINAKGRVIDRKPGAVSFEEEAKEKALNASMFQEAEHHRLLHVHGYIDPARLQINLEHYIRIDDIMPFVANSPLIPRGREIIYARGFYAGLVEGDFLVATHFLIPQLESSLRYVLEQHGIITSGLDDEGIQEEYGLNKLLDHPKLTEIFGEDVIFDLKGLLVERWGANLRHSMAHGLMNYDSFFSTEAVYLWWLILRLTILPLLTVPMTDENKLQNS